MLTVQRQYFSTKAELKERLQTLLEARGLEIRKGGLYSSAEDAINLSRVDVDGLFPSEPVESIDNLPQFLLRPKMNELEPVEVAMHDGGSRFSLEYLTMPESILLKPSIDFEDIIFWGLLYVVKEFQAFQNGLFNEVCRDLFFDFTKIGSFLISNMAADLAKAGVRLNRSRKAHPFSDIRIP